MTLATRRFIPVLDCPDPRALAGFYRDLLGWQIETDRDEWFELARDESTAIAFQLAPDFVPQRWPDEGVIAHLDFNVPNLDDAERVALDLGATRVHGPSTATTFRVFRDPAGHHFCLCSC
ncbi:VOC family protein [Rhodococcus artemisiae]|uniref:VOC family protein n=1 Tax=Rhodococcus artemisiae TaxID=714159 RepID=A0ABU7L7S5_9NOCA|nr:VOC family protein [Rhodococcus artemisiae]MEE2057588.1 VOC family protein [Rhodococcus artemisiae]